MRAFGNSKHQRRVINAVGLVHGNRPAVVRKALQQLPNGVCVAASRRTVEHGLPRPIPCDAEPARSRRSRVKRRHHDFRLAVKGSCEQLPSL